MGIDADIVVIGGGPCGSFSALAAARLGARVVVCEEHSEIGAPSHCTGHVSISGLERLRLSLPREIIENEIRGAVFYSPSCYQFSMEFVSPVTYVINRKLFDKHLSNLAVRTGVKYLLETEVKSILKHSGVVSGVTVQRKGGFEESSSASIVIDAEGFPPRLFKRMGVKTADRPLIVSGVQADVDRVVDVDEDFVEVYVGRRYAPGFFAWIVPRRDGSAKVGLATSLGNPREYLQRFMREHPLASKKLGRAQITNVSFHPIPLSGPIPQTYSNGLLVVGDAASHVKPTTGGGVVLGLLCSRIAGEVAYAALRRGDLSEASLSQYQNSWKQMVGFDLAVMRQARRLLNQLPDDRLDRIIGLCRERGIDRIIEEVGDLDFQGRMLIRAIRHPTSLVVLIYFLFSSLFSK